MYRRIRYGYTFRRIPLTQGKYAIVDPEDYQRISAHKWHALRSKNTFYAKRAVRVEGRRQVVIKMHREILQVPDGMLVDHINHNGLDNRNANLRPATSAENNRNRRKSTKRKYHSRFKGVSWNKDQKKWSARILFNYDNKFIGYFENETEAAKAYDEAAKFYHKDFAVLNFSP
ncbi:MAG: endonuclease [Planctomycetes bacterium]|nr:endonuclease [Planctomycetota bacterium]